MNLISTPPSADFAEPFATDVGVDDGADASFEATPEPEASPEVASTDRPAHYEIAAEAYTRYLERGARDGYAVEDWLEAEKTVRDRRARAAVAR